ncbi:hypothetical protein ACI3ER_11630 [Bacillus sp. Wb]
MIKLTSSNQIELTNVIPVEQFGEIQYYTTTVSIQELHEVYEKLTYDGDAQRGMLNGKPMIDSKHVNQIYESFMNGNSIRGHLTWNLRKQDGTNDFVHNIDTGKMIISNQVITIPDSAHRHEALKMIAETVDDESILESRFSLDIYNLSKTEEKELFYTINGKVKAPNRNRTLYLSNDISCRLLRDVIAQSNLDGRIECVRSSSAKDGKLTKFSTLYDSLFGGIGAFDVNDINENTYDEYLNWLIDFYNELVQSREEFSILTSDGKAKSKESSMILEEISWWGYSYLAKELMGMRKWKHDLFSKMNKKISVEGGSSIHFMQKTNPIWHATVIKPKYNFFTKTQEAGSSVTNSNITRGAVKKIFYVTLF